MGHPGVHPIGEEKDQPVGGTAFPVAVGIAPDGAGHPVQRRARPEDRRPGIRARNASGVGMSLGLFAT